MNNWLKKFFTPMRGKKFFTTSFILGVLIAAFFGGLFIFNDVSWVHAQPIQSADFGVAQVGQGTGMVAGDIRLTIARVVRAALGFLGTISFVLCLYAGFIWMTSGGSEEKIGQAKKILVNAAIGLVIIASSYGLTTYLITQLLQAVNGPGGEVSSSSLGCTGPDCIGGSGGSTGNVFFVNSLPPEGGACVQNVHPVIVFNRDVDIATVQGSIIVQQKNNATEVAGSWVYGSKKSMVMFVPSAACTGGATGCFEPSTDYQVQFKNASAIRSLDNLSLNCNLRAGCKAINFTSGTGVETNAPRVTVLNPAPNTSFPVGDVVPFVVSYTSDSGVQNVSLYQSGQLISGQQISGCAPTGTVNLSWSTAGLSAGNYTVESLAAGWSGVQGNAQTSVTLAPLHCFDTVLDAQLGEVVQGPPACGGECGSCGGSSCKNSAECASGYCDISGSSGVCVDRMRITDYSPRSGAVGTYVTIAGLYFGNTSGDVYFSKVSNPRVGTMADWVKAQPVMCVAAGSSWSSTQILVEVPSGAVSGPILVQSLFAL